jgi:ribosomal protein S18 acetylase RimI-like enzyme
MTNKRFDRFKVYRDVASLHTQSIKTGFLPTIGIRFLTLMYRCIDEVDDSTLIVKYKGEKLVGFVSGTIGTSSIYQAMMRYPIELMISVFPIIFSLTKLKKIYNIIRHMHGKDRNRYPKAELLTICVSSDYRRKGIAKELFGELSDYFFNANVKDFVIIVGKTLKANSFYTALGANIQGELHIHNLSPSNVYIKSK